MIKQLTKAQYLQLTGLLALAKSSIARLEDIEDSIRSLLEITMLDEGRSGVGDPQYIGDAIYSGIPVPMLLVNLGLPPDVDLSAEEPAPKRTKSKARAHE